MDAPEDFQGRVYIQDSALCLQKLDNLIAQLDDDVLLDREGVAGRGLPVFGCQQLLQNYRVQTVQIDRGVVSQVLGHLGDPKSLPL